MTKCKHCGQSESDHCTFEPRVIPDGCVCNIDSWFYTEIPPVCDEFKTCDKYCDVCEHDEACHKAIGREP